MELIIVTEERLRSLIKESVMEAMNHQVPKVKKKKKERIFAHN